MSEFASLEVALEGHFDKPLADLPAAVREHPGLRAPSGKDAPLDRRLDHRAFTVLHWDDLLPRGRRLVAQQWDSLNDPGNEQDNDRVLREGFRLQTKIAEWRAIQAKTITELQLKENRLAELDKGIANLTSDAQPQQVHRAGLPLDVATPRTDQGQAQPPAAAESPAATPGPQTPAPVQATPQTVSPDMAVIDQNAPLVPATQPMPSIVVPATAAVKRRAPRPDDENAFKAFAAAMMASTGKGPSPEEAEKFAMDRNIRRNWGRTERIKLPLSYMRARGERRSPQISSANTPENAC